MILRFAILGFLFSDRIYAKNKFSHTDRHFFIIFRSLKTKTDFSIRYLNEYVACFVFSLKAEYIAFKKVHSMISSMIFYCFDL